MGTVALLPGAHRCVRCIAPDEYTGGTTATASCSMVSGLRHALRHSCAPVRSCALGLQQRQVPPGPRVRTVGERVCERKNSMSQKGPQRYALVRNREPWGVIKARWVVSYLDVIVFSFLLCVIGYDRRVVYTPREAKVERVSASERALRPFCQWSTWVRTKPRRNVDASTSSRLVSVYVTS
jgi:hypothetical protein